MKQDEALISWPAMALMMGYCIFDAIIDQHWVLVVFLALGAMHQAALIWTRRHDP